MNTSTKNKLTPKDKFNALSNATHIFAFKEDAIVFKLIELVNGENDCKAVVETDSGLICGLFTDSSSARAVLNDVKNCFGDDQPFITIKIKTTSKGQTIYYAEVE